MEWRATTSSSARWSSVRRGGRHSPQPGGRQHDRWMNVVTHDRTGAVPARVKEDLAAGLAERTRHLALIDEAEVEFDEDAKRGVQPLQVVGITLRMTAHRMQPIRTRQTGHRLEETVDVALHTIEREIDKLKGQLKEHP